MKLFKLKTKKEDFTVENLPHNRKQVFLTVFKNRFTTLFLASLLAFAFAAPSLIWTIYMRFVIRQLEISYLSNPVEGILTEIFYISLLKNLVNLPLLFIFGFGIGGLIHIINQLIWNEMVFVSDFFKNFKSNFLRHGLFMVIFSISYSIVDLVFYGNRVSSLSNNMIILMYGISLFQLILFSIFVIFLYMQNEIYNIDTKHLITNAIKFTILCIIPFFPLLLIGFIPVFLQLFDSILCDLIMIFLVLILTPVCLTASALFVNGQFDKFINKELYPTIYKKGIY